MSKAQGTSSLPLGRFLTPDKGQLELLPPGFVDDASRMNPTRVAEVWNVPDEPGAAERQLIELLQRAKAKGLRVSIAGTRHSMGGHTIYPDGIVVNMLPFHRMELDDAADILHVQSGARWSEVLAYLDTRGRSVAIMQSNNSFSVGGSISVNCHGWQTNRPPIASSVVSLRLLKADGTIVRCSRTENPELFSLVLGGYGLFGVILDVDLRVVPNERYRMERFILPAERYVETFSQRVRGTSDVAMAYGRLCVVPDNFLREATITVFHRDSSLGGKIPPLADPTSASVKRAIFRSSVGSDEGKRIRWKAEKSLEPMLTRKIYSRNQLLNEGVEIFENRSYETTDILHEYFVPADQFAAFLARLRTIIPKHRGDLLNVTVRDVRQDRDSFLRYAENDVLALVMLFNHPRTPDGEVRMEAMTQEMIDAVHAVGGRYYLPYRLHATVEQFHRVYPQARQFFDYKRRYDPDELFQNQLYLKYDK